MSHKRYDQPLTQPVGKVGEKWQGRFADSNHKIITINKIIEPGSNIMFPAEMAYYGCSLWSAKMNLRVLPGQQIRTSTHISEKTLRKHWKRID